MGRVEVEVRKGSIGQGSVVCVVCGCLGLRGCFRNSFLGHSSSHSVPVNFSARRYPFLFSKQRGGGAAR